MSDHSDQPTTEALLEELVRFEFARIARDKLGMRCVAIVAASTPFSSCSTWFAIQLDVGRTQLHCDLEQDRVALQQVANEVQHRGARGAARAFAEHAGDTLEDWCETVRNRMAWR